MFATMDEIYDEHKAWADQKKTDEDSNQEVKKNKFYRSLIDKAQE